jgi:hypothetical protein
MKLANPTATMSMSVMKEIKVFIYLRFSVIEISTFTSLTGKGNEVY